MNENIVKIEAQGFQDLCNHIRELEEKNKLLESENTQLKADTNLLGNELTYFKEYAADLEDKVQDLKKQYDEFYEKEYLKRIDECNDLWGQLFDIKHMSLWEFANKYCGEDELKEAGHELAKSLLGGA